MDNGANYLRSETWVKQNENCGGNTLGTHMKNMN